VRRHEEKPRKFIPEVYVLNKCPPRAFRVRDDQTELTFYHSSDPGDL